MKNFFIFTLFLLNALMAETNSSIDIDENNLSKMTITEKQVKEQMEREKKYAKEQIFYQGDDYNLSTHEVNKNSLAKVPLIETDLDFDMDDVYRDDL